MSENNKVVMAGASGMLGGALAKSLQQSGWQVVKLVRSTPQTEGEVQWDPAAGELDPQVLAEADAIVCFSGAPLVRWPWTRSYKKELVSSRIGPVETIVKALKQLPQDQRPAQLVTASAVGYYGDRGEEILTEDSRGANDFLAGLCRTWEERARQAPVECTTQLRTGIVIGDGGFISALAPLAKLGALGSVGSGEQWMPPIALEDHVRAVRFIIDNKLCGPINLVGPQPHRHREVMAQIAAAAGHKPAPRVPAAMARIGMGDMAQVVLTSQRVLPTRLESAGFKFNLPSLEAMISRTEVARED
ncbi:MAG: TIGR01777 family oxidoreductase [Actinomycetaceae bacterium]|nr:TIGR01777 family oxidoreductase [Actinomycetaceae bacterium]